MNGHDLHDHHEHNEHGHAENCACGMHKNDHAHHAHDENGSCILAETDAPGVVHTEAHLHDDARVISGHLTLTADYDKVGKSLADQLEKMAKTVQERGGIVGHIKASCTVRAVEMFSVTEMAVTVKKAPDQEIKINLAAIVFLIDPEEAEKLTRAALEAVRAVSGI